MDKKNNVRWEAEEYVLHEKNTGWYVGLLVVGLALVLVSVLLKWWTFTALVILSVVALVLYAVRPPRRLKYALTAKGLTEGERLYKYEDYKSFGVLAEDGHFAIVLMPRKRFSPVVTVYFPEEQGEAIVDMFGARLPMAPVKLDILDKIVRMLRI